MKSQDRTWSGIALLFLAGGTLLSCSTARPRPSSEHAGREGLFQRWSKLDSGSRRVASANHLEGRLRHLHFRWPLAKVEVTSPYGKRGHDFHEGIDLRAKSGTSVYSAHAGRVLYAGEKIRGYGKLVVIRHSSGISTVYAHNSKLMVKAGQWVREGTRIAVSGQTGHVSGPHLHFEIRNGVTAIDPQKVMPRLSIARVELPAHSAGRVSRAGRAIARASEGEHGNQ